MVRVIKVHQHLSILYTRMICLQLTTCQKFLVYRLGQQSFIKTVIGSEASRSNCKLKKINKINFVDFCEKNVKWSLCSFQTQYFRPIIVWHRSLRLCISNCVHFSNDNILENTYRVKIFVRKVDYTCLREGDSD